MLFRSEMNNPQQEALVEIYTLEGMKVASGNVEGSASFMVPGQKQVYLVRIVQDGKVQTGKVFPL